VWWSCLQHANICIVKMNAVNYSETLIIFTSLRDGSADKLVIFVFFIAACVVPTTWNVKLRLHTCLATHPCLQASSARWAISTLPVLLIKQPANAPLCINYRKTHWMRWHHWPWCIFAVICVVSVISARSVAVVTVRNSKWLKADCR